MLIHWWDGVQNLTVLDVTGMQLVGSLPTCLLNGSCQIASLRMGESSLPCDPASLPCDPVLLHLAAAEYAFVQAEVTHPLLEPAVQ